MTAPLTTRRLSARATVVGDAVRWHTIALDRDADRCWRAWRTGLLGANGAGKTTLLGVFLDSTANRGGLGRGVGLDPTTAGPQVRARVGYAPEHHRLPDDLRAVDFVAAITASRHGLPTARQRAGPATRSGRSASARSGFADRSAPCPRASASGSPSRRSDRPRPRAAPARRADRRSGPVQRDVMLGLIRRVGTEFGTDVVLSSHLLEEIERIATRRSSCRDGAVAAAGPPRRAARGRPGWSSSSKAIRPWSRTLLRLVGELVRRSSTTPPATSHRRRRRVPRSSVRDSVLPRPAPASVDSSPAR